MTGLFVLVLLGVVLAGLTSVHTQGRHANDDYEVDLNLELRDVDDGDGTVKIMLRSYDRSKESNDLLAGLYKRNEKKSAKKTKRVEKKAAKKPVAKKAAKKPAAKTTRKPEKKARTPAKMRGRGKQ